MKVAKRCKNYLPIICRSFILVKFLDLPKARQDLLRCRTSFNAYLFTEYRGNVFTTDICRANGAKCKCSRQLARIVLPADVTTNDRKQKRAVFGAGG